MAPLAANLKRAALGSRNCRLRRRNQLDRRSRFSTARILFNWLVLERCAQGQSAYLGRSASDRSLKRTRNVAEIIAPKPSKDRAGGFDIVAVVPTPLPNGWSPLWRSCVAMRNVSKVQASAFVGEPAQAMPATCCIRSIPEHEPLIWVPELRAPEATCRQPCRDIQRQRGALDQAGWHATLAEKDG